MKSISEISNRFSSILTDSITKELSTWLRKQMEYHGGDDWWHKKIRAVLSSDLTMRFDKGAYTSLEDFDLYALLLIFHRNYRFLERPCSLPKNKRRLVQDMLDVRNRCTGHRPASEYEPEILESYIDTSLDFCQLVNISNSTSEELTLLRNLLSETKSFSHDIPRQIYNKNKSLEEKFSNVSLTQSQNEAVEKIDNFLKNRNKQCFILKGYAGTGKTFLIGGIIRYLRELKILPVLLAPTGRAARVINEAHNEKATTIHKHIYKLDSVLEYREIESNGSVTFKFYFGLKGNQTDHDSVFIVDESSMIADVHSEAEFMHFGSGRLLKDLIEYIDFDANDHLKKVIFVGDNAQLEPVDMSFSPALNRNYLLKNCRITAEEYELTDVVRQKRDSSILKNATAIRRLLQTKQFTDFKFHTDNNEVKQLSPTEFFDEYLRFVEYKPKAQVILITYTNKAVSDINTRLREIFFPGIRSITVGDLIMVQKNNYNYSIELYNGQIGRVAESAPECEMRKVFINTGLDENGKRKTEPITLLFRDVTLLFKNERGTMQDVTCKIFENILNCTDTKTTSKLSKALYVDFRNRKSGLKPGTKLFSDELKIDPWFNALHVRYSYAVTCHKAQGGEWPVVFVDFDGQNKLHTSALRWSYTAITRAREKLFAVNVLQHNLIPSNIQQDPMADKIKKESVYKTHDSEDSEPAFLSIENQTIKNMFHVIKEVLPPNFSLYALKKSTHQVRWNFRSNAVEGHFIVYYNKKLQISKVTTDNNMPDALRPHLYSLVGKKLDFSINASEPNDVLSQVPDNMKKAVQEILNRCRQNNVACTMEKKLSQWSIRLLISKQADWISLDMIFNNKGQCSSLRTPGMSNLEFKEWVLNLLEIINE